jgi:hypothetical protein
MDGAPDRFGLVEEDRQRQQQMKFFGEADDLSSTMPDTSHTRVEKEHHEEGLLGCCISIDFE